MLNRSRRHPYWVDEFSHPQEEGMIMQSQNSVTMLEAIRFPQVEDMVVRYLQESSKIQPEIALVSVEPNGMIGLHSHETEATMLIVAGTGVVLSHDDVNGIEVRPGHRVYFAANQAHGFKAGCTGLSFVSINGGIRRDDGSIDFVAQA